MKHRHLNNNFILIGLFLFVKLAREKKGKKGRESEKKTKVANS